MNKKSKRELKGPRFEKAEKDYRRLMEEIAPFTKKKPAKKSASTAGTWVSTDAVNYDC